MNSSENWDLHVDPGIYRFLGRIPRDDAERILGVIKLLPVNPHFGDIQKMKGEDDVWRRRIGPYRIFYKVKVTEKLIFVFHLERRTSKAY